MVFFSLFGLEIILSCQIQLLDCQYIKDFRTHLLVIRITFVTNCFQLGQLWNLFYLLCKFLCKSQFVVKEKVVNLCSIQPVFSRFAYTCSTYHYYSQSSIRTKLRTKHYKSYKMYTKMQERKMSTLHFTMNKISFLYVFHADRLKQFNTIKSHSFVNFRYRLAFIVWTQFHNLKKMIIFVKILAYASIDLCSVSDIDFKQSVAENFYP